MSVLESTNLRDLLRVRDNEDDGRDALAGLTLSAVLGCESPRRRPSRTLLDIIKDEESGAAYRGLVPPTQSPTNNTSWRSFKSRLRLCRAGAAFSSSSSHPNVACDYSIDDYDIRISSPVLVRSSSRNPSFISPGNSTENSNHTTNSPTNATSVPQVTTSTSETPRVSSTSPEEEHHRAREETELNSLNNPAEQSTETNTAAGLAENSPEQEINVVATTVEIETETEGAVQPPRVSLMALLEETDWNAGSGESMDMDADGVALRMEQVKTQGDIEIEEGGVREFVCCICMVRHKGAAFIPCGHTFCRICSRELWANRGNCPLCNRYILEILDIF